MGYALPYTHIHSSVLTRQVVKLPFSRFGTISPHYLYRNSYTDELGITPPILENRNRAGGPADPPDFYLTTVYKTLYRCIAPSAYGLLDRVARTHKTRDRKKGAE